MDNAWGILRCVIDLCMKQVDGKYLILRDPNKVTDKWILTLSRLLYRTFRLIFVWNPIFQPLIHLFSIPDDAFESEDGDSSDDEVKG